MMSRHLSLLIIVACSLLKQLPAWADTVPEIVNRAKPAVVEIIAFDSDGSVMKTGTGFFIGSDGVLLTNFHVVSGAESVVARTPSGAVYFLERVMIHPPDVDAVMLKFQATDVAYLKIGSTKDLVEGQKVLVIGNPEDLQGTVSDGIISAFRNDREYIQISAPISPGSSGSPVLTEDGKVIGVATLSRREGQNLNFAISVDRIGQAIAAAESSTPQPRQTSTPVAKTSADDFVKLVARALETHNWEALAPYLVEGSVNYFGRRKTTIAWIRQDMENDKINYPRSEWTLYPETFTHEVSNEYSPQWSGPMIYDSVNVYSVVTERNGRVHRAMTRQTVGYTENKGVRSIYALVMKVLPSK